MLPHSAFLIVGYPHSSASDICLPQMPKTEETMYKRDFRMKGPKCTPNEIEWIEMTGREFYHFVNSPERWGDTLSTWKM